MGLSAQAARNLYTQRVDPRVVSYLLESYQFAEATRLIAQYLSGELAAGIAAHNELFHDVSQLLRGSGISDGTNDVLARKFPRGQELDAIQKYFLAAVKGMEKDVQLEVAAKKLTGNEFDRILSEASKGEEAPKKHIAPSDLADSMDLVRTQSRTFEGMAVSAGSPYRLTSLDDLLLNESGEAKIEIRSNSKNPERIYLKREGILELRKALNTLDARERDYLIWRYGFDEGNRQRTRKETAKECNLTMGSARKLETQALDDAMLELPWWYFEDSFFPYRYIPY